MIFNLLAQRDQRRATIITTNLLSASGSKASATRTRHGAADRLTHHSHILTTRGDLYRGHKRKTADDAGAPPSNDPTNYRATAAKTGGEKGGQTARP